MTRYVERLRYAFDKNMARGTSALIGWLAVLAAIVAIVVSLVTWFAGLNSQASFGEHSWTNLMNTFNLTPATGKPLVIRVATFVISITAIFVTSMLIGLLTTGFSRRFNALRKGRSRVLEDGHTVILGWSPQVFPIINELVVANENQRDGCVVILGDKDKVEMEDEIRSKCPNLKNTRVICRHGTAMEMADLRIVNLPDAKSIIILAPEGKDPDSRVIKTLLAITNQPERKETPYHIVTQIHDPKNTDVAKMVGRDEVEIVLTGDLIARITAQASRQCGLSVVYSEILSFEGNEIYFQEEPTLVGKTFGDALLAYEDSAVIGLCSPGGTPRLNPSMDTPIGEGDAIIAISEDDDTVVVSGTDLAPVQYGLIDPQPVAARDPEQILVLGWNWRAPAIILQLDNYVAGGSEVTVVADVPEAEAELARRCSQMQHLKATFCLGDTTSRQLLDQLSLERFEHVILLSYSDKLDVQQADARTLITLLHLRDIWERHQHSFSIASEMLDIRNRDLAEITRADDFIVSDRFVSLIMSQISETKALGLLFKELFDAGGAEISFKPAERFVRLDQPMNFYTVVEAARRSGEVAIGYRIAGATRSGRNGHGVVLNPDKSKTVEFRKNDQVMVLAHA